MYISDGFWLLKKPTGIDRLLVARLSAGDDERTWQNMFLYPLIAIGWGCSVAGFIWLATILAPIASVLCVLASAIAAIVCIGGIVMAMGSMTEEWQIIDTTADWLFGLGKKPGKDFVDIGESLALSKLSDALQISSKKYRQLNAFSDEISAYLLDSEVCFIEEQLRTRPESPSPEELEVIGNLERKLQIHAMVVAHEIRDHKTATHAKRDATRSEWLTQAQAVADTIDLSKAS